MEHIINMAPLVGVLGSNSLDKLYGTQIHDKNVLLMLRHRAVLFGIVGSILGIVSRINFIGG
jgi:hypothetical protein